MRALDDALAGTYLEVIPAPFDVLLERNVVEPDLVVAPNEDFRERDLATPVLVVEVRSASTGWIDTGRKREIYESAGIASFWRVDPAGWTFDRRAGTGGWCLCPGRVGDWRGGY